MTPLPNIEELYALQDQLWDYLIWWSCTLAIRWIRESSDIDVLVSTEVFEKMLLKHPSALEGNSFSWRTLVLWNVELVDTCPWFTQSEIAHMLKKPEIIQGLPFISLTDMIHVKKTQWREKDFRDLEMIKEYQKNWGK